MKQVPFHAYQGKQPYVFVSYAHVDSGLVYGDLEWLHDQNHRIWFDEGIKIGHDWPDAIAQAIERCSQFLLFLSPNAAKSRHVHHEIHYALNLEKPIVPIYLEHTDLRPGLKMTLQTTQAINRNEFAIQRYREILLGALISETRLVSTDSAHRLPSPDPEELLAFEKKIGSFDDSAMRGLFVIGDTRKRLVWWIVDQFLGETGINLDRDHEAMKLIEKEAENAYVALQRTSNYEMRIPFITTDSKGPVHLQMEINHAILQEVNAPG